MSSPKKKTLPVFTLKDVEKRAKDTNSCIFIVGDDVVDAHSFLFEHPGGDAALLAVKGTDATLDFESAFHSDKAKKIFQGFVIGKYKKS